MKLHHVALLVSGFALAAKADVTTTNAPACIRQYDKVLIGKISDHWFQMMDTNRLASAGSAIMEFRLFPDGHVSDLKLDSSTVAESGVALCKKAVLESAPFAKWPKEVRQICTNDFRVIHFTFYFP